MLSTPFMLFNSTSQYNGAQNVGPARMAARTREDKRAGSLRAIKAVLCPEDSRSQSARQEAIKIDGLVPAGQQLDAILHGAQTNSAAGRRGWGESGDRLAVPRDHDTVAALHGANEFRKAILRFRDAHIPNGSNIARFSGHINSIFAMAWMLRYVLLCPSLPGASPEIMASAVATPLERQFSRIAAVTEMTSSSALGYTGITLQFDLNRDINAASRDVEAAINAARGYLPTNLPSNPTYRQSNPADDPIFMLTLTSPVLTKGQMYDAASSILAQKLSQVNGVGQVVVGGSSLPAVRVELDPTVLNKYGIGLDNVRSVLANANANNPKGQFSDGPRTWEVGANDQLFKAIDYQPLIVAYRDGNAVRISDVGKVVDSVEDLRNAGYANGKPSVIVLVWRQPNANIIGIVKKNAIMMVDFALAAERNEGKNSRDSIYEACLLPFRPILMTTMAAILGAVPLALSAGTGSELRRPLGIAIIGELTVSQLLTLYTTPVVYLYFDRLQDWWRRHLHAVHGEAAESLLPET